MEVKKIKGMDVLDLCLCSQKQIKALKKFKNLDTMNVVELETEFWEIQSKFDSMTQEQAESEDGLVLGMRQRFLMEKAENDFNKKFLN